MKIALYRYSDHPDWRPSVFEVPEYLTEAEQANWHPMNQHRVSNMLEIEFTELTKAQQAESALMVLSLLQEEATKVFIKEMDIINQARQEYQLIEHEAATGSGPAPCEDVFQGAST